MTDKQTAALKLALEAIEACLSAGTEAEDQDASDKLCDARAAIREALAEQPTQCWKCGDMDAAFQAKCTVPACGMKEQPAQEPVAYAVYHRMGGSKSLHWPAQHSEDGDHNEYQLVPLYASPQPAQQSRSDYRDWDYQDLQDKDPELVEQPAQKRPQNCGTGYCSCIECLFEQPNIDKYLEKDNSEQPAQEPVAWKDEQGQNEQ